MAAYLLGNGLHFSSKYATLATFKLRGQPGLVWP